MGQYYKAVMLKKNKKTILGYVDSWDYDSGSKLMEHSWLLNPFVISFETLILNNPKNVVWAGDYADECLGCKTNIYQRCEYKLKLQPEKIEHSNIINHRFIVNHSKKLFVDKLKLVDVNGWCVHPLPLLTCEGNGRGGGDYRGEENTLVGTWARDLISIESSISELNKKYEELLTNFAE